MPGSLDDAWKEASPYCYDDHKENALHASGSTCATFVMYSDDSVCDIVDDRDFTAREKCCECGGGVTRSCENIDNGAKNSLGYSCVDIAVMHSHGHTDMCHATHDSSSFNVATMCCACGGGTASLSLMTDRSIKT